VIESWHSTLEFELRGLERFATKAQARDRVAAWIDEYNRDRKHSSIGMRSPIDYELTLGTATSRTQSRSRHDPRSRHHDDRAVLAGVKAKPSGWPAASPDTSCGRHRHAPVGGGQSGRSTEQDPLNRNRSLYGSGDCRSRGEAMSSGRCVRVGWVECRLLRGWRWRRLVR
jgi:hypothetical protein